MEIILPEYAKYVYEINYLRIKVSKILVYKAALQYHICKYIELDYMLKIGALEYKERIAENKVNKAKKMLYYIEEHGLNAEELKKIIEKEFEEEDKKILLLGESVNNAIDLSFRRIPTEKEIIELNSYYMEYIQDYSPDININNTKEEKELFKKIEEAYISANLNDMRKFNKIKSNKLYFDELDIYKIEKIRLESLYNKVNSEIIEIKNQFPYTEKLILQDENLFRRKKESINSNIQKYELEFKELEKKLRKL